VLKAAAQGPIALLAELASKSVAPPVVEAVERLDAESMVARQQAQHEQRLASIRRAKREQQP
jgi:hypothetical protein